MICSWNLTLMYLLILYCHLQNTQNQRQHTSFFSFTLDFFLYLYMYLYALFLFMVPQTVPMLTNNQLQVLQHSTMTKVINSLLRLINGQRNLIDKSFRDSTAPLCCCRVLCRYEADSIFFLLLLFVVKGRPASDNVLRFPVASKTSGRDEC